MSGDQSEEKTLPASARKLRKAREKGQVVTSKETVMSLTGTVALLYLYLRRSSIAEKFRGLWELEPAQGQDDFWLMLQDKAVIVWQLALELAMPVTGLVIVISVLSGMLVSGGPVFSTDPLLPKFEKINPASGFKRIFSRKAFLNFLMNVIRLSILSAVFGLILSGGFGALMRAPVCGLGCAAEAMQGVLQPMVIAAVSVMVVMAGFDYLVNRSSFMHEQKMTQSEFKREMKEQTGDPQMRSHLRRERRQMVTTPTGARYATVVVTGGGAAVGVRYVEGETPAPLVVARSRGGAGVRRLVKTSKAFEASDPTLVAMMQGLQPGQYVTEDDAISRLAPLLQQAILQAR